MAGELEHASVGTVLDQAEWESASVHTIQGGVQGDLVYFDGSTLKRIPIGTPGYVLTSFGVPIPTWRPVGAPPSRQLLQVVSTTPYNVVATDPTLFLIDSTAGPLTLNLLTSVGLGGLVHRFKKISADANMITIDAFGAQTIDGDPTVTFDIFNTELELMSDDANWKIG